MSIILQDYKSVQSHSAFIISTIQMFFGKILHPGQVFKFEDTDQGEGDILSITNVVLTPNSKQSTSLFVKKGNEQFLIATLTKERSQAVVTVFISIIDQVSLVTKGNGTLHITGFYEQDQEDKSIPNLKNQGQNQEDQEEAEGDENEQEEEQEEEEEEEADSAEKEDAVPTKVYSPVQKTSVQPKHQQIQSKVTQEKKSFNQIPSVQKKRAEQDDEDAEEQDDEQLDEDVDQDLDDVEDDEDEDEDDVEDDDEEEESEQEEAPPQKYIKHDSKPQGVKSQEHQAKFSLQGNKHTNLNKNETGKPQQLQNQSQGGNNHHVGQSYNNQGVNKHTGNSNIKEGNTKFGGNENNKNFNKNQFQKH